MASSPDILSTAQEKTLETITANQKHQAALIEQITQLQASLTLADKVIDEGKKNILKEGIPLEDLDKEHLCIHVPGAIKLKMMTSFFDKPDSPFKEDSEQRARYETYTTPRPWAPADRKHLQDAVIREQKRAFASQAKKAGHPDPLGYVQSQSDSFYVNQDAAFLDWERVANMVSAAFSKSAAAPRSALDCKVCWLGSEQPSIHKTTPWSDEEAGVFYTTILDILRQPENKGFIEGNESGTTSIKPRINWTEVSSRMNGTRTPIQCLRRWIVTPFDVTVLRNEPNPVSVQVDHSTTPGEPTARMEIAESSNKRTKNKSTWTNAEDDALRDAVKIYGTGNWASVALAVSSSRTARQCSERWRLSLDPNIKRGKWTQEEDDILSKAVQIHGTVWMKVKNAVSGRTTAQCRERWCNHLDPSLNLSKDWTVEEDEVLHTLKTTQPQLSWTDIAKNFPGRTDHHCFRRWEKLSAGKADSTRKKSKSDDTSSEGDDSAAALPTNPNQTKATKKGKGKDPLQEKARVKPKPKKSGGQPTLGDTEPLQTPIDKDNSGAYSQVGIPVHLPPPLPSNARSVQGVEPVRTTAEDVVPYVGEQVEIDNASTTSKPTHPRPRPRKKTTTSTVASESLRSKRKATEDAEDSESLADNTAEVGPSNNKRNQPAKRSRTSAGKVLSSHVEDNEQQPTRPAESDPVMRRSSRTIRKT